MASRLMKRFMAWINERHAVAHRRVYQGHGIYMDGSPLKRKMDVVFPKFTSTQERNDGLCVTCELKEKGKILELAL